MRGYFGYIWDADGRQLAFVKDGVLYGAEGRIGTINDYGQMRSVDQRLDGKYLAPLIR